MLRDLSINLTEPICGCSMEHLAWDIRPGDRTFVMVCRKCSKRLETPYGSLKAGFHLTEPIVIDNTRLFGGPKDPKGGPSA